MISSSVRQQMVAELSSLADSGPWELRDKAKAALKISKVEDERITQDMDTE